MTAIESQILEQSKQMAERSATVPNLEQLFAVIMLQARAQESRKLANGLMISPGGLLRSLPNKAEVIVAGDRIVKNMIEDLLRRSHELEEKAKEWAENWPPEDKPAPGKLVEIHEH
ncbi:MAG: hypothetical protein KGI71_06170 [Patescibacteria group bacterium]|nr:hypothetical protein [Patescibacteria group bacterium]